MACDFLFLFSQRSIIFEVTAAIDVQILTHFVRQATSPVVQLQISSSISQLPDCWAFGNRRKRFAIMPSSKTIPRGFCSLHY